ncbi:hypothetical protein CK203_051508 [Vitis vinifera]|uniref:Uncharacterized protein n=1 Tax=Vitis vinifera TaxID=29760 RepID=A0A438GDD6_VITVI|nr:hypothetical protein CK203_051508 [Vitis vinifera]
MEFSGEMNIYRESELSGDFEEEIRERRNQQEKNQAGFGGSETNLPLQATLPTLLEQVLHSSYVIWNSWSGGFLGILGLEGEKAFFDAPAPSVRGS